MNIDEAVEWMIKYHKAYHELLLSGCGIQEAISILNGQIEEKALY